MAQFTPNTPHSADLARRVAVFPAVKNRRQAVANIWFFDSPKNGKRHIVTGDLQFMSFVLLEGSPSCLRYEPIPQPVPVMTDSVSSEVSAGAYVYFLNECTEWLDFQHAQRMTQGDEKNQLATNAAQERGMRYLVKMPSDMKGQAIRFDNRLNLCAGIKRCRTILLHRELAFVVDATRNDAPTVGKLLSSGMERACMFAAIALSLAELAQKPFACQPTWRRCVV